MALFLEDGGFSDPHFGGLETFRPVTVDKIVEDGEIIEIGNIRLKVHYHPGHTEEARATRWKSKKTEKRIKS